MSEDFLATQIGFPKLDTPLVQANEKEPGAARIISIPWHRLLTALWNRTGGTDGNPHNGVQTGVIQAFAGSKAQTPDGYLYCDGLTYAVADFPDLFAILLYREGGAGDSFAVPNLVNRLIIGGGDIYPLGSKGGAASQALQPNQIPSTLSNAAAGAGLPVIGASASGQLVNILPPYYAASWIIKT